MKKKKPSVECEKEQNNQNKYREYFNGKARAMILHYTLKSNTYNTAYLPAVRVLKSHSSDDKLLIFKLYYKARL